MNLQTLRDNIVKRKATVGSWVQMPCPDSANLLAKAGYDWVAVDLEHGAISRHLLPDLFRAILEGGALPFARLGEICRQDCKAALDSGAQGIIFPMIETREDLDKAIGFCLYPDQGGKRGVGFCVANTFGQDFDAYCNSVAKDVFLVAQIEHIRAVDNLDEILSHPRLDAIMVGPYDLSGSLGVMGQLSHEKVVQALAQIQKKAVKYNIPMGLHIVSPNESEIQAKIREGYLFIAYGIDTVFLLESSKRPLI